MNQRVAIGPRIQDFGSWQWIGEDLASSLADVFAISIFEAAPPVADVTVYIKFLPPVTQLREIARRSSIVYCPVDVYGSAAEIDRDAPRLLVCDVIVVHAPRLRPYFQSYAATRVLDHHLKYAVPTRSNAVDDGPILWVGVRTNLPPLTNYVNRHSLPAPLIVLTNPENEDDLEDPERFGFGAHVDVQVESWTPTAHRQWLARCRAALDIKGDDFRARHKPAAKALDYLASGVPLAMNAGTSSVEAVRALGFDIVPPEDWRRWLSADYARATQDFGRKISIDLSLSRLADSWREILTPLMERPQTSGGVQEESAHDVVMSPAAPSHRPTRIAIISLLFNWPSTGGGTVHTAETARFLARAGYDVEHWVIRNATWSVGQVTEPVDWPIVFLDIADADWCREGIQQRVASTAERFVPDHVLITDSWSFKPRLAEALRGRSYFLRLAAQECLCPLSNIRLLRDEQGGWRSCPQHQLATPELCHQCVAARAPHTGGLHRAERVLSGFDEPDYDASLRRAFREATGILVVNPLIAECVKPYTPMVHVLPSGFDRDRFPPLGEPRSTADHVLRILFAGLIDEPMKGFAVLHEACRRLWNQRQDFRLVATADPPGSRGPFMEFVGWKSQAELPELLQECDIVVCPTVAEEALGRTAVEAMGAGRPVVASRIGGLSFTVLDEATGLLCHPGDPADLQRQLARLLDDAELRTRLGTAGRRQFIERYTWDVIIPKYVELLGSPVRARS